MDEEIDFCLDCGYRLPYEGVVTLVADVNGVIRGVCPDCWESRAKAATN